MNDEFIDSGLIFWEKVAKIDFSLMRWELAVAALAVALLLIDLFLPKISKRKLGMCSVIALGVFLFWSFFIGNGLSRGDSHAETAYGFYQLDLLAIWSKQFSMLATLLTILMSMRFWEEKDEHLTEYILLQLMACLGMMLISSAGDFLSLFISLELMTISFYILVSFQRKNVLCLEAGLKYLIYGALSSGVLLYGITLIYGTTGEIHFSKIAQYSISNPYSISNSNSNILFLGLILVLVGIAFKISAAPFHWWTPDVYEGAPTPTVALLSIGSKGAGFILLVRVLMEAFSSYRPQWLPLICIASGSSILYGNLAALSQNNLKRLMGYSSISHSGYMLLGIAAFSTVGLSAVLYYLIGYLLANALIFGVMCETNQENPRQDLRTYVGLGIRSQWAASALSLGLLSLSGIPPLAGFFGKLLLFRAALEQQFYILLVIALIGVICSLYYYLNVLRTIYTSESVETHPPLEMMKHTCWTLGVLMILIVVIGFYQLPWWDTSEMIIRSLQP